MSNELMAGEPAPKWLLVKRLERAGIDLRYQMHEACEAFGIAEAQIVEWVRAGIVERTQVGLGRFVYDGEALAANLNWKGRHPKLARWYADQERRPVTRAEVAGAYRADPDEWVYKCCDASGAIIYVGITNSALGRFRQHSEGAPWFREVVRIDIEHCPSRRAAEMRELDLIRTLRPKHNLSGKPKATRRAVQR